MKDFWNIIQLIFAAIGGWLGYFFGGWDVCTDYIYNSRLYNGRNVCGYRQTAFK